VSIANSHSADSLTFMSGISDVFMVEFIYFILVVTVIVSCVIHVEVNSLCINNFTRI